MKIYFTGAQSVGKTTLANYVSKTYNLTILPECARMVLAEKELQIDKLRSDIDIVNLYQETVFNRQFDEESKLNSFVSDRSVIDSLAYSAQHARILPKLLLDNRLKSYIENLNKSIIFFVRPSKIIMKNDGVREQVNWENIISIDGMIKFALEMFEVKYFQINTDSMQERTRYIDNVLSLII